jgi:hypothetical protein
MDERSFSPFTFASNPPPADAYRFSGLEAVAISTDGDGDSKKRKVRGVCYSGGLITGHWYWSAVIFDLSTTKAPERVPVLIEHDRSLRAGFASLSIGSNITCEGQLMDNEHGNAVASESDEGFPWQMSVHIQPGTIEEVQAGATVTVNGQTITGPAYIFKNNLIREVSLTPTGADPNTHAVAASLGAGGNAPNTEAKDMEKLDQLTAEVNALTTKFSALTAENEKTKADLAAAAARADAAEKALAERTKADRFATIKSTFAELGRKEPTEAEVAPYLAMEEATFSAVVADLKASKPAAPDFLFKAQATDGASVNNHQATIDRLAAL